MKKQNKVKKKKITKSRRTSERVGKVASKVLKRKKSSKRAKIVAGSALSQRAPKRQSKKRGKLKKIRKHRKQK